MVARTWASLGPWRGESVVAMCVWNVDWKQPGER